MYTNTGILQVISINDAAANLGLIRVILDGIEAEKAKVSEREFDELVRWEEDIKAHFLHRTEMLGMTNVSNNAMKDF